MTHNATSENNTLSVDNTPVNLITFKDGTSHKVMEHMPSIMEGLASGLSVQLIADQLGISRSTVWRSLQRVDFEEINSMLVTDILADIPLIDNVYQRNWLRAQLLGKLHSKKVKSESTVKIHSIEDKRNISVVLDKLDFDTQRKIAEALQSEQDKEEST